MSALASVKRLLMQLDLHQSVLPAELPAGFSWQAWDDSLLDVHASVKLLAFQHTPDTLIFPNLGSLTGCRLLMRVIRDSDAFCPAATWLMTTPTGAVGTIQGLMSPDRTLVFQNIGIIPAYQNRGLGSALVRQAIHAVQTIGARRVRLEVTASNAPAVRVYRRIGFRVYNTIYRPLSPNRSDATVPRG